MRQAEPVDIEVLEGDITTVRVDAVVTAANAPLVGGGGVDGAVHTAAGPRLLAALREGWPDGIETGQAVVTPAFDLSTAQWVIHAVGPVWRGGSSGEAELLESAYVDALARADDVGAASVAFPAISTGVYGYPKAAAAQIAVRALRGAQTSVEQVLLVAFDAATGASYRRLLGT
ncbi:MAG: O-acetyl-ADP-ribose deacetylase [Actinomycetota bacterium]|nr:O-acetyl-ADP-ribose deacetylase [Actinomycetota bacterium]